MHDDGQKVYMITFEFVTQYEQWVSIMIHNNIINNKAKQDWLWIIINHTEYD